MTSGRAFSFSIFSFGDLSSATDSDVAFSMSLRITFLGYFCRSKNSSTSCNRFFLLSSSDTGNAGPGRGCRGCSPPTFFQM